MDLLTASDIKRLLSYRHKDDVFVLECKDGPTWGGLGILDGWAMKKSWAHPLSIGYEIKVSRTDFVNDKKWRKYLECCNEFYFVCPFGMIDKSELPEEAGLIVTSKNLRRLYTKKKAPHRKVVVPESLYRYILMSRATITDERTTVNRTGKAIWEEWERINRDNRDFGNLIACEISKRVRNMVGAIKQRNNELERKHLRYDNLLELCKKIGFDLANSSWNDKTNFTRKMDEFLSGIPDGIENDIKSLQTKLSSLSDTIKNVRSM